ncbi:MAG: hypothetical protein D3908_14240, partial [Candidatus Electrothrix sp. AUS4]|nr:hypothetical protein [Candidatus Electrothrix sp. AUS4]
SCGLYRLLVAPISGFHEKKSLQKEQDLKDKITAIYASHRNLCEDIQKIVLLRPVPCRLEAAIRLDGTRSVEEILAMIYHQSNHEATARLEIKPYPALVEEEQPEDLLNGPLSKGRVHGLARPAPCPDRPLNRGQLFSLLKKIPGIERVDSFLLSVDQTVLKNILAAGDLPCYHVSFPETPEQSQVRLTKNGRMVNCSWSRFRTLLEKLEYNDRALRGQQRNANQQDQHLYSLPQGTYRNPGQYTSIQNLFPDCYGINAHGVPKHYPAEEKAAAAQLKAYLLPFEQVLADYLAQLEHIPSLFSVEQDLRQSYYRQQLDSTQVPGIDKVLIPEAEQHFQEIQRRFDTYRDRKSRILDYLLALYGERFTGISLRNFNWYQERGEFEDEIITIKSRLLKQ